MTDTRTTGPRRGGPFRSTEQEIVERVRRIETRLTQTMIHLGITTTSQHPVFVPGHGDIPTVVRLPSPHTSLKEVLSALPDGWTGPVRLHIGSEMIGTFVPDRN